MELKKNLHLEYFARFLHVYWRINLQGWAMLTKELFKVIAFSLMVFILIMAKVMAQSNDNTANLTANTESVANISDDESEKNKDQAQILNPTINQNVASGTSYQLVTTFSTNTAEQDSYRNQNAASYELFIRKGLAKGKGLMAYVAYGQNLIDQDKSDISDALITYQLRGLHKTSFGGNIGANIGVDIPLSERSHRLQSKITAINIAGIMAGSLQNIGLKNTSYFVNAGGKKFFHRFKQTLNNQNNVSHRARILGVLSQQLTSKFTFTFLNLFDQNWSYEGTQRDVQYYHEESLGYLFDKFSLEIGHNNSGRLRNNEFGPSENFEVFNEKSSTYFLRLSATL